MRSANVQMKTFLQVLVVLVTTFMAIGATKIKFCELVDNAPPIEDVKAQLGNCTEVCKLTKGGKYNYEVHFKALKNADEVWSIAVGLLNGYDIKKIDSVTDTDACQSITDSNGKKGVCPLKKGQSYIYNKPVNIDPNELPWTEIQWRIVHRDQKNNMITCFEVPVDIED